MIGGCTEEVFDGFHPKGPVGGVARRDEWVRPIERQLYRLGSRRVIVRDVREHFIVVKKRPPPGWRLARQDLLDVARVMPIKTSQRTVIGE